MKQFPEVQGGGSLILAWQVRNKHILVVGGGEVAAGRILNVLNADAKVTVVCPAEGLNDEVAFRVAQKQVTHIDRNFLPEDLDGVDMVLTAVDDPAASTQVWTLCKERRIPVNVADVPPECDFYFGSVHRDGPLQVMISTNGNGPKLANIIRRRIAACLPDNTGGAIRKVGVLRRKLRKMAPAQEEGPKRMQWMSKVCEKWSLDDLCEMTEEDMNWLLQYYKSGIVPSLEELRLANNPVAPVFDGSFGCTKISFADLARNDEDFAKIFKANKGHIDYQNPEHVQLLTKSLLKRDFGLQIELPSDRLCPPVPQRWAYIQWISRLLDSTTPTFPTPANPNRPITGIDIGTGASAIYPLLACATHPTWKFIATELDVHSITSAAFNIALNNLAGDITLHRPSLGSSVDLLGPPCTPPLLPPLPPGPIDFTMCNPPFFASQSELSATWTKSTPPSAVCTGSESEMITPGGEVAFVTRLVAESAAPGTRDRVQWFSSLLGRLVSLRPVVEALRQAGCANWAVGVLRPGGKTRRWVVAWSWGAWRPSGVRLPPFLSLHCGC
ncbi:hypothetical protein EJ06DRAFT_474753 [Trichodelitschia bisporula]|uniref:precorrin-2 dehydrogenase n=1 Tax=Trichodelitschia bisporula TaxID=703511 RepID=A0A6G1I1U9_9PEZI|nr:hypothetical protein EJ06DRAFT_474753 [Trichodelitschia bisporula]